MAQQEREENRYLGEEERRKIETGVMKDEGGGLNGAITRFMIISGSSRYLHIFL